MSRGGVSFADAFIENSQFVNLVFPSDADSNSWESENIISPAANDWMVTGTPLVKIHPNRHLEWRRLQSRNGKTLKGANDEWWTNNPNGSVSISKRGKRQTVFEAHTAKWNFLLVLTVNVLSHDVLCFMTVKCLSNRYFVVQFYNRKQKEDDTLGLYIYIFAAHQTKSDIRNINLYNHFRQFCVGKNIYWK